MSALRPLCDQVMVITGASSGIGLATARMAAKGGAKVVLVGRAEATLKPIVRQIASEGGVAAYVVANVGERAELVKVAEVAVQTFGRIDTWVSNAGVAIYADLLTTPREQHERLFRTNYWGAVNSCEVAIPHLRLVGGTLIVVGSIASSMGSPVMGAYVASKHAVKGYVDSLRIELNRDRVPVVVTLIKPSGIDTPLAAHLANHRQGEPKIPPPIYAPDLVARTILHAAVRPTREITVGGLGLTQVMIAAHLPAVFAHVAGAVTPLLNDATRPATAPTDNLFVAGVGGEAQGRGAAGRAFSLYTHLRLNPFVSSAALSLLAAAGLILMGLRQQPTRPERRRPLPEPSHFLDNAVSRRGPRPRRGGWRRS